MRMDLSKPLICLNCGKTMEQGGTEIGPYGMTQFRFCGKCRLRVFLFTEVKGYKYSLFREKEVQDDK